MTGPKSHVMLALVLMFMIGFPGALHGSQVTRAQCRLVVINITSHTARLYADHDYVGTIEGHATRYLKVENGRTDLYARATCHGVEWGPDTYILGAEFTWRLTP